MVVKEEGDDGETYYGQLKLTKVTIALHKVVWKCGRTVEELVEVWKNLHLTSIIFRSQIHT